jgi:hypothetical protein
MLEPPRSPRAGELQGGRDDKGGPRKMRQCPFMGLANGFRRPMLRVRSENAGPAYRSGHHPLLIPDAVALGARQRGLVNVASLRKRPKCCVTAKRRYVPTRDIGRGRRPRAIELIRP